MRDRDKVFCILNSCLIALEVIVVAVDQSETAANRIAVLYIICYAIEGVQSFIVYHPCAVIVVKGIVFFHTVTGDCSHTALRNAVTVEEIGLAVDDSPAGLMSAACPHILPAIAVPYP